MSILALGRKHKEKENSQSKKGRRHKTERKFPMKEWEKAKKKKERKKERKNSRSRIGRKRKKCIERSLDQTISKQYKIVTKSKNQEKGNHDLKWSSPFDCQPKSCALATFSPRTKQKQKRRRQKHSKPNSPPKNHSQNKSY